MKILLKGYYGFGNFGDDILLLVGFQVLKENFPDASIDVYSGNTPNNIDVFPHKTYYQYIKKLLPAEQVNIVDWKSRENYDLVFNAGGGLYKDHTRGGKLVRILNTLICALSPQKIYTLETFLRKVFQKKLNISFRHRVGYGISIGPLKKSAPSFIRKYTEIGSYDILYVRDQLSLKFLEQHSFRNRNASGTDLAFLTGYWLPKRLIKKNSHVSKKIGVILIDWHKENYKYLENVSEASKSLEEEGYEVTYISFQEHYDLKFQAYFDRQVEVWDPQNDELNNFLSLLSEQDLLITSRAHGAIIGGCLGVPAICLGITQKLEEVSKMFNNSSVLIKQPFSSKDILQSVHLMFKDYPDILKGLEQDIKVNKELANQSIRQFFEEVKSLVYAKS